MPGVESVMMVVVLLLDGNNNSNNNNHNNNLRINRDDVALVKSGKFKDCVLSWMFGRKTVASPVYKYWYLCPVWFVSCAHVPCCVNGQCFGVLVLRLSVSEMYAQLERCGPSEFRGWRQFCRQLPITLSM